MLGEDGYRNKYKYKNNKNKIYDDEEGEEDSDELEESYNKNTKKKSSNSLLKIIDYDDNDNNYNYAIISKASGINNKTKNRNKNEDNNKYKEERMNLKYNFKNISPKNKSSNNSTNKIKYKNILDKRKGKLDYLALIEELRNEIKVEKKVNLAIKSDINYDLFTILKQNLSSKKIMLEKLKKTCKKQNSALNLFSKDLDKENKKRFKIKSQIFGYLSKNEKSENSRNLSKKRAADIVLKVKEKELYNALNIMNALKSENEELKKILYENDDYNNNINMEDKSRAIDEKIKELINEKNDLEKQLKVHKKCIEEQNRYNSQIDNLNEELKQLKDNIQKIRNKTQSLISKNSKNNLNLNLSLNKSGNLKLNLNSPTNRNINASCSTPNMLANKYKIKNLKRGIILPLITAQKVKQNESVLTDYFKNKIRDYLNNDEEEYITLIEKIKNLEKSRRILENKHKNELKQFDSQLILLDEQFKILKGDSKGTNCNIRILKYRLNVVKGENKNNLKKLNELMKELQTKIELSKEKDHEISLLTGEISSLKKYGKYGNIKIPKDESSDYVDKLIQEREEKLNKNENIDEYVNENVNENFDEYVNKNIVENADEYVNENINENANEDVKEKFNEDIKENMKEKVNEKNNEDANEKVNKKINEDANEKVNEKFNENSNEKDNENDNEKSNENANEKINEKFNKDANEKVNEDINEKVNENINDNINENNGVDANNNDNNINQINTVDESIQANFHESDEFEEESELEEKK